MSVGLASSFRSVPDLWQHRVGSTPEVEALKWRVDGRWRSMTWGEAGARVRALSNALLAHGLKSQDRCALFAGTSMEWVLTDFAILSAGGATTTIYPQASDAEVEFILGDCGAKLVFVDSPATVERLRRMRARLPAILRVVAFHAPSSSDGWVQAWSSFEAEGRDFGAANPEAFSTAARAVGPDDLATLMYTSGTTGRPKGVMLTHDAWVYEAEAIDALGFMNPADVQFLWLPLAHVFAKVLQLSFVRLGIPTIVDGSAEDLVANLRETRPTWFAGVPRTFEKAVAAIDAALDAQPAWRRPLIRWARDVGRRRSAVLQSGRRPDPKLRLEWRLADKLVFREIRERFGGRLRFLISGGAPLPREVAESFHTIGLLVLEGYGLTESSAASTVNRLEDYVFGTVGPPLPGCDVRIGDDGEILLRSRGIMKGYWNDDAETRRVLKDGWLATGDLGQLLPSGHLRITGRKKELIVTAGGKNVAPLHVETLLRTRCPYVSHVLLHGDRRPYCVALVTLDPGAAIKWARQQSVPFSDLHDLAQRPELRELVQGYVDAVNRELPSYEHIRRFAVLGEDFTLENGLLTPSLKVRRPMVESRHFAILEGMYDRGRTPLPASRR